MKSLVLLLCLAQLWGCHSAPHLPGVPHKELACDDVETEQAALAAVDYLNQQVGRGFKHTLNQIDKVQVLPRRPFGELYVLELDTLETICHVLDPTPLENCTVRQVAQHAVEGDCEMRVLKVEGQFTVLYAQCESTPDSAEDVRKVCPNCPLLAQFNDTRVVHAVNAALAAFNAQHNGSRFELLEISRAQLVPLPVSTYVEFAVVTPDCVAAEGADAACSQPAKKQHGFCKATLTEKLGGEEVAVSCTIFQTQEAPQPPPEVANPANSPLAVDPPGPPAPPAPVAVLPARVVSLPVHRKHYDLRHSFTPVGSVESASGEAFKPEKPKVTQPVLDGSAGPVPPRCPGRIRHFKI
ncbi:alpha-2-HS-glycoprotein [Octodon degus]|uniref:Alpha-2-HS-glycoprotein n=1 Tax=Octodon degus TaxID=10160 RepID=A0A6P3F870_OCTDE|nr:alpha-2-HS-glycoprotein [Octodon degus]